MPACTQCWEGRRSYKTRPGKTMVQKKATDSRSCTLSYTGQSPPPEDIIKLLREKGWQVEIKQQHKSTSSRLLFLDRLDQAIKQSIRNQHSIILLVIDLDDFKKINAAYGYTTGDKLLNAVTDRMANCLRQNDSVTPLGSDEFAVILNKISRVKDAEPVADKILLNLSDPFCFPDTPEIFISASIGISSCPDDGQEVETLLTNGETAMRHAKNRGGNCYRYFTPDMNNRAAKRKAREMELRRALVHGEIKVHYQPIIDLVSGRVAGAEALVRWLHPEHGEIAATELIPLANDTGLIQPLGRQVMSQAISQAGSWHQKTRNQLSLYLSVNFSKNQFRDKEFEDKLTAVLHDAGLPINSFWLEITEDFLMDKVQQPEKIMSRLKDMGATLVLDDFGTGKAPLVHLRHFPIDAVKIDVSFLKNLSLYQEKEKFIRAIIAMAHNLDFKIIAKGIETEQQLDFLRSCGCDMAQGYYFARPMAALDFEPYIPR